MNNNAYILEWYGPFSSPDEVVAWEQNSIGPGKTYLYLFKGKKKYAKTMESIYCGQAFKQAAGKRLKNKNHHINEVLKNKKALTIWVAKFSGSKPHKYDVNLVEKALTSVLDQVIKTDTVDIINETNKLRPRDYAYIINEWYKIDGNPWSKYRTGSISSIVPDFLACYPDEEKHCSYVWGNQRMKFIKELK